MRKKGMMSYSNEERLRLSVEAEPGVPLESTGYDIRGARSPQSVL